MAPSSFWDKVQKTSDCWLWTGSVLISDGYGQYGRGKRAHRVAWELTYGPIHGDLYVLHRCDVRLCVRPAHLFLGTQADNMADMARKGRARTQRITHEEAEQIREIVGLGVSQREVARVLGMHHQTIWRIVHRKGVV